MPELQLPNFDLMSDEEVLAWVSSLTKEVVYAHLPRLTEIICQRFGENARIATATFQPPRVIYLVAS